MKKRVVLFLIALFTIQVAKAFEGRLNGVWEKEYPTVFISDSLALENDYVKVMRDYASCTGAHTTNVGTRVIVALEKIKIKSSKGIQKLNRGQIAVFLEGESYELPKGSFFEIALKKIIRRLQNQNNG